MIAFFKRVWSGWSILCILAAAQPLGAVQQIQEISREGRQAIRVAVSSPDATVLRLAQRGFTMHGGFTVVAPSQANWLVALEPSSDRIVWRITAPSGGRQLDSGSESGDSLSALRRSMDAIVLRLTRKPGFFSGTLAFVAEASGKPEIYTSDIFFQRVVPVTQFGKRVVSPRWSPDGSTLVFTSYAGGGYPDIVSIDLVNRSQRTIANYRGVNIGARFSPDGRRLAFVASSSGTPEVYISNPDGSSARRMTWTRGLAATPTWAPDGRRLIFTSDDFGGPQLVVLDIAQRSNTRIRTGMGGYNAEGAWNPVDADQVAFTASVNGQFQLGLYRFSTGRSIQLTREAGASVEPVWLADGRHLVYTYRDRAGRRLRILDSETGASMDLHSSQLNTATQADFVNVMR